jgi:hypothetical protein
MPSDADLSQFEKDERAVLWDAVVPPAVVVSARLFCARSASVHPLARNFLPPRRSARGGGGWDRGH